MTTFFPRTARSLPGAALAAFLMLAAAPPPGAGSVSDNPHAGMACGECHVRVPEKGKTAGREVLETLTKDPVDLCRDCHSVVEANHHPVIRKTARTLPGGLPLAADGGVICSTCHDVHLKAGVSALLRGFDTGRYAVRMDMCLDCHGERFGAINPHRAEAESEKCYTCHSVTPRAGDGGAAVSLHESLQQACNFCHNVKEKAHPQNVDPMRKLPDNLPRSRKGEVMCGTCHDPHGTEGTLHFLRPRYVEFLEAGRYSDPHGRNDYGACMGCHLSVATKDEEMRGNLRYGGEDLPICLSCHGAMDSCHPILVKLRPGMDPGKGLPLSPEGKIKCLTCHDPLPKGGSGVAMREREPGQPVNAICFRCHDRLDLSSRNPHASMSNRETCKFCHDTMTDPTNEEAARVSFISNTRLICLRCHGQERHPGGIDHMVIPKMSIPDPFRLDGKGKITCTTCHNPHIEKKAGGETGKAGSRFVIEGDAGTLCSRCHRR